jgi:hypothetical protein
MALDRMIYIPLYTSSPERKKRKEEKEGGRGRKRGSHCPQFIIY